MATSQLFKQLLAQLEKSKRKLSDQCVKKDEADELRREQESYSNLETETQLEKLIDNLKPHISVLFVVMTSVMHSLWAADTLRVLRAYTTCTRRAHASAPYARSHINKKTLSSLQSYDEKPGR